MHHPWASFVFCLAVTSVLLTPNPAAPKDYVIDSREYKLILDESKLQREPASAINTLWDDLKPMIDQSVGMKADGSHRYSGKFTLAKQRAIRYWDTANLNKCVLDRNGYSVRERTKMKDGKEKYNDREITLKFRSPDLYLASRTDIQGKRGAKSKLEEDIVPVFTKPKAQGAQVNSDAKPTFRSIYSYSLTQPMSSREKLTEVNDLLGLFNGLERHLRENDAKVERQQAVAPVSDLTLYELVYDGTQVDLGNMTADFSISLWYKQIGTPMVGPPLIAELSFKYPLSKNKETATRTVLSRAMSLFSHMQQLDWISTTSSTKTGLVYNFAHFCSD